MMMDKLKNTFTELAKDANDFIDNEITPLTSQIASEVTEYAHNNEIISAYNAIDNYCDRIRDAAIVAPSRTIYNNALKPLAQQTSTLAGVALSEMKEEVTQRVDHYSNVLGTSAAVYTNSPIGQAFVNESIIEAMEWINERITE